MRLVLVTSGLLGLLTQIVGAAEPDRLTQVKKLIAEYDAAAHKLAGLFRDKFRKYENIAKDEVKEAGPRMAA